MRWDDIIRVRVPEPEEVAEKERQKELAEQVRIQSGEKELNDLQTKLADCFLNSWIFAAGEGPIDSSNLTFGQAGLLANGFETFWT